MSAILGSESGSGTLGSDFDSDYDSDQPGGSECSDCEEFVHTVPTEPAKPTFPPAMDTYRARGSVAYTHPEPTRPY